MNHQQLTVQQSFSRQQAQGPAGAMQGASGPSGGPRYCPTAAPAPAPPAPKPQSQQQARWQFKVSPGMGQTKNNHNNSHVMQSTPQQARMGQSLNNSTTDFYGAQTTQPQEVVSLLLLPYFVIFSLFFHVPLQLFMMDNILLLCFM